MISHLYIGVNRFQRAFAFYDAALPGLGWRLRFVDESRPWAGWQPCSAERPLLLVGAPLNSEPADPGNGQMIALLATTRAAVTQFHAIALAQGGSCEGAPGLRPHYHPDYFGAYVRDLDGNKIAVCCHSPG